MAQASARSLLTRNQTLVYGALEAAAEPLSAYGILDRLRDEGIRAPLQIYRALDKLVEAGLVHRLESLNAFVACRQPDCEAHETIGFAICQKCGQVTEFAEKRISGHLADWARKNNFTLKQTTVELRGACATCKAA